MEMFDIFKKLKDKIEYINKFYNKFSTKKPQKYLLQFLPSNIFLVILFFILMTVFVPKIIDNKVTIYAVGGFNQICDEVVDYSVEQNIYTSNSNRLEKLGLFFLTYERVNDSLYKLEVFEDDKVIYSKEFNSKDIDNNNYKYFNVNISNIKKNVKYKYVLTPVKVKQGQGITTVKNSEDDYGYNIVAKSDFYIEIIVVSIIFFILFFGFNYFINNKIIKSEKKFLLLALLYLIPILFIYPINETPDEEFHFRKAVGLSQYDFKVSLVQNMIYKRLEFPKGRECYVAKGSALYENVVDKKVYFNCLKEGENIKTDGVNTETNRLISSLAPAVGVKLADIFSNRPMVIYYMGRLFNFLLSFFIILFALNVIPKHKKLLLMVVLIPMFIQQMISYSYDSMLNSLCILIVSYLIKFCNIEKIEIKDLIIYSLASLIVLDIKIPYILLCLPILFINKDKFGKERYDKIKRIFIFFVILGIGYFILNYISKMEVINSASDNSISTTSKLLLLLAHPKSTFFLIYNTFKVYGFDYFVSTIGRFGWYSKPMNLILVYSYVLFLVLVVCGEKSKINTKFKFITIFISLMSFASIFVAMYVSWTPIDSFVIQGVQGRYFLPILFFVLFMLISCRNIVKINSRTIYSFLNLILLFYVITLLIEFY